MERQCHARMCSMLGSAAVCASRLRHHAPLLASTQRSCSRRARSTMAGGNSAPATAAVKASGSATVQHERRRHCRHPHWQDRQGRCGRAVRWPAAGSAHADQPSARAQCAPATAAVLGDAVPVPRCGAAGRRPPALVGPARAAAAARIGSSSSHSAWPTWSRRASSRPGIIVCTGRYRLRCGGWRRARKPRTYFCTTDACCGGVQCKPGSALQRVPGAGPSAAAPPAAAPAIAARPPECALPPAVHRRCKVPSGPSHCGAALGEESVDLAGRDLSQLLETCLLCLEPPQPRLLAQLELLHASGECRVHVSQRAPCCSTGWRRPACAAAVPARRETPAGTARRRAPAHL